MYNENHANEAQKYYSSLPKINFSISPEFFGISHEFLFDREENLNHFSNNCWPQRSDMIW